MSPPVLGPEAIAITSNLLREPLSSTLWLTIRLLRHLSLLRSLCLRGLFPLSDLWYSSQSPSHRQSTFTTHELRLVLSQSKPRLKLCRWLGGSVQKFHTPYFLQSSILTYYKHSPQRVSESSHPTQYIFEGDFSLFLFSSYIIPKWSGNVKLNRIFFYLFFRYSYESLTHSIRLSCFSLLILLYVFILWFHFSLNTT